LRFSLPLVVSGGMDKAGRKAEESETGFSESDVFCRWETLEDKYFTISQASDCRHQKVVRKRAVPLQATVKNSNSKPSQGHSSLQVGHVHSQRHSCISGIAYLSLQGLFTKSSHSARDATELSMLLTLCIALVSFSHDYIHSVQYVSGDSISCRVSPDATVQC
jgi:hypothetical protein